MAYPLSAKEVYTGDTGTKPKTARLNKECNRPGKRDIPRTVFQKSGKHDQHTLSGNNRNPVKSTPDTDEESLFMRIESQHVKAVRRNIMCGGTESQQPEYSQ